MGLDYISSNTGLVGTCGFPIDAYLAARNPMRMGEMLRGLQILAFTSMPRLCPLQTQV